MFPIVVLAFLVPLGIGLFPLASGRGAANHDLLVWALPGGLAVARVVLAWVSNPDGVKDLTQGGVVGFKDTPYRLSWYDWAIVVTRKGTISKQSRTLRLERRLCFGLIPLGGMERPLDDFYRVELDRQVVERSRGDHHNRRREIVRFDYAVQLVGRADKLTVLDVSDGASSGSGSEFVARFRSALEDVVAADRQRSLGTEEPGKADPPPDDFEVWRAQRESKA